MSRMIARTPVYKFKYNFDAGGDGNVTASAWTQLISSMPVPTSAVEIFNSSEQILKLSTGAAASEDGSEIPYYILPGGSAVLLPIEVARAKRLAIKAVSATADTGYLVLNFFG